MDFPSCPQAYTILEMEHRVFHTEKKFDECLWCNGFLSEWWRKVNLDDEE